MAILRTKKQVEGKALSQCASFMALVTELPIHRKSPPVINFLPPLSPWPHSWKLRRSSSKGFQVRTKASNDASNDAIDQAMLQRLAQSMLQRLVNIPKEEEAEKLNESQEEGRSSEEDGPDQWKRREAKILREILPIRRFVKNILHSNRYKDGDKLTPKDENKVVEKLLQYHPHSQDKIGCGVDAIMVGRHPKYDTSRCLFIIRKDGQWTDFSYIKCLMGFIRMKYPSSAEKFIEQHFRRHN